MDEYRAARGGHALSRSIFDLLSDAAPKLYPESMRVSIIGTINDILQGRSKLGTTAEWLQGELREKAGEEYPARTETLCREVAHFMAQKAMLTVPYTKTSTKEYQYRIWDPGAKHPLKVINQRLLDWAAKAGFPPGFFKDSYFDDVTIYCIPDYADLSGSHFQNCAFSVCRILGAYFSDATIYDSEFQTCHIENASFIRASLAHTQFHDSFLSQVSLSAAHLTSCNTIDCTMADVIFFHTTLDGCSYGRVTAKDIIDLDTAKITMGGATGKECALNKASIFEALGVPLPVPIPQRSTPTPSRSKRHAGPER